MCKGNCSPADLVFPALEWPEPIFQRSPGVVPAVTQWQSGKMNEVNHSENQIKSINKNKQKSETGKTEHKKNPENKRLNERLEKMRKF